MTMRDLLGMTSALGLLVTVGAARAEDLVVVQGAPADTNLGSSLSQPRVGGGVMMGPGAPTSAFHNLEAAPDQMTPRGPPPPGAPMPRINGGMLSGGPTLTPGGDATPGNPSLDGRSNN